MVSNEYEIDHTNPQKISGGRCILTLYLTTSTHRRGGNNGNNRAETMQKPTKKGRNNAFLAEKRLTAALGPSGRRFDPCHSDQKSSETERVSEDFYFRKQFVRYSEFSLLT